MVVPSPQGDTDGATVVPLPRGDINGAVVVLSPRGGTDGAVMCGRFCGGHVGSTPPLPGEPTPGGTGLQKLSHVE